MIDYQNQIDQRVNTLSSVLPKIYPYISKDYKQYIYPLIKAMDKYLINNVNRQRAFLSQIGIESGQLSQVSENLNYSKQGLRKVFGKYFATDTIAAQYARKPQAIANIVYANRLGNGNTESGDGWRYRGRGLIQLTGKGNYKRISDSMGVDFVSDPDLLLTPRYATLSAAWYWYVNKINTLADNLSTEDDYEVTRQITKRINGGYNGLAERYELYTLAKKNMLNSI